MQNNYEIAELPSIKAAALHLAIPRGDITEEMGPAVNAVLGAITNAGLSPVGPMFAYHLSVFDTHFDFEVGFPIAGDLAPVGKVRTINLPAVSAFKTTHTGPYIGLYEAWTNFGAEYRARYPQQTNKALFREIYRIGPETTMDESKWETDLFIPIANSK